MIICHLLLTNRFEDYFAAACQSQRAIENIMRTVENWISNFHRKAAKHAKSSVFRIKNYASMVR